MNKICGIIVSYNPQEAIISNVSALLPQVDEVVVVDNGSTGNSELHLRELAKLHKVSIIYNDGNLGIAAALNIGVKYAIGAGYLWVATFDQDSKVTKDFFYEMLSSYKACNEKDRVASISPTYYNQELRLLYSYGESIGTNEPFVYIEQTMTSGSLIKVSVFESIGFFKEDFFLDFVDNEFCLRCLRSGYRLIESCRAVLYHQLGRPTKHMLLRRQFIVTNHSSLRRYYNARNRVVTYKEYFRDKSNWIFKDFSSYLKELVVVLMFEHDRPNKFYYILKGFYHASLGKMGRYET